ENLSSIRKKLRQNSVKMDHSFAFAKEDGTLIAREDEENITLEEVADTKNKVLHLRKDFKPNWESLNERLKLDFGRLDEFKIAERRAYVLKDCEMNEFVEHKEDSIEIGSNESETRTKNLFLAADANLQDFTKFGI